jgi:hypothetical protein
MKYTLLICLAVSPAFAEPAPRLVPTRDVAVIYQVQTHGHGTIEARVAIEAGGRHLQVTSPELPTTLLVDRPAGEATILLPLLRVYATVPVGRYDLERTMLHGADFVRMGQGRVAGLGCTNWRAISLQGQASACITSDGVILSGTARDQHGDLGEARATFVSYGALPPDTFQAPEGYKNAGSLPLGAEGLR